MLLPLVMPCYEIINSLHGIPTVKQRIRSAAAFATSSTSSFSPFPSTATKQIEAALRYMIRTHVAPLFYGAPRWIRRSQWDPNLLLQSVDKRGLHRGYG